MPAPDFNRTDADVTLFLLQNKVAYTAEVTDPWFRAPIRGTAYVGVPEVWMSNDTITGIGCTEQWQFCNDDKCAPLGGINSHQKEPPSSLELNSRQNEAYKILWQYAHYAVMDTIMQFIPNEVLLAQQLVYGSFLISGPLPKNQWHLEVQNFHNITMAQIQAGGDARIFHPEAEIMPGMKFIDYLRNETDPEALGVCKSQKMRNSKYVSFSMFGFMIIVVCSIIIIAVNLFMVEIFTWLQTKRGKSGTVIEWREDDVLRIQQHALQSRGIGPWKLGKLEIPVTEKFGTEIKREYLYPPKLDSSPEGSTPR